MRHFCTLSSQFFFCMLHLSHSLVPSFSTHLSCLFRVGQSRLMHFGAVVRHAEGREQVFLCFNIDASVPGRQWWNLFTFGRRTLRQFAHTAISSRSYTFTSARLYIHFRPVKCPRASVRMPLHSSTSDHSPLSAFTSNQLRPSIHPRPLASSIIDSHCTSIYIRLSSPAYVFINIHIHLL